MKTVLLAIIQVILVSGIFYGYYHLFLRNKRFHQYNRFYLLIATIISLLIPFLNIPVYFTPEEKASSLVWRTLSVISSPGLTDFSIPVTKQAKAPVFTSMDILYCVYLLVVIIVLTRMILSLLKIRKLTRTYPVEQLEDICFVNTKEPGTPFSFFRWLFWHKEIELHSEKGEQIFRHELFHIRQKHSLDIIFMELVTAVCWINPFFHLIKKETKAIHEFLADQFAARKNREWDYAELLLMQVFNTRHTLVNPFFHNQIKRRIAMITSSQQPKYRYFRKVLVLPLLALVAGLFAFTYKQKKETGQQDRAATLSSLMTEQNQQAHPERWNAIFTDTPKIIIRADSSSFRRIARPTTKDASNKKIVEPDLIIINSKEYTSKELKEKFGDEIVLETGEIEITGANDPGAIKKYGPRAKNGVIIMRDVKVNNETFLEQKKKLDLLRNKSQKHPLIVVDEEIQATDDLQEVFKKVKPETIKEINVLKDKTATDKYGEQGANGVIEIKIKELKQLLVTKIKADTTIKESIIAQLPDVAAMDNIISKLDKQPQFQGGENEWRKYLMKNLNPLVPADKGAAEGTYMVKIQFIVDHEGNLSDIQPLTNHGFGMEEEVIRVLKAGPRWEPGIVNGKPVNAYKQQPVTFVIETEAALKEVVVNGFRKGIPQTIADVEKTAPVYPNPATNSLTIPFNTQLAGQGEIRILDAMGKIYLVQKTILVKGLNILNISVATFAKGMYIINVTDANKRIARIYKMVKE